MTKKTDADDRYLRILWRQGYSLEQIADVFHITTTAIQYRVKQLELPARDQGRKPEKGPQRMAKVETASTQAPKISPQNRESGLLGALVASKGKWDVLSAIAAQHGFTSIQVQQRYHQAVRAR